MVKRLVLLGAMLGLAGMAQADNLLTNGNFEDGPTGNISAGIPGWNVWGGSGWHHDDAGRTEDTKAIVFWWDDAGMWQDFAATGGINYAFSVDAFSWSGNPLVLWNGLIKAEFYNSAIGTGPGQALAEAELGRFYGATDPQDTWVTIGGSLMAPAGTDVGRIVIKINDWQAGVGGVLNFDNAAVTPEPATLALLALGGLALRRRAARP
jgi:hypothetical protein